ncbi:tyrosine-type recombinase/integrase, partial [Chroococcidiopsis sp.]|uniref:tyrosine-type recombinase/integrase n=1 Tax=Chroococcidiopsis sp. TaxID=3088168 RepID=UPI003F35D266
VAIDKGSIRLSFPKRHTPLWELMDGKSLKGKPKYLYLGKAGFSGSNPDDVRRAELIAVQMESDLDHPEWDKLFDRTLEKYGLAGLLGGKYAKLADILQLPGVPQAEPEITVGTMWEAYLEWKKTTIEETTFKQWFRLFSNTVSGRVYDQKTRKFSQATMCLSDTRLDDKKKITVCLSEIAISAKSYFLRELNQAFDFCKTKGMLVNPTTDNPFVLDKFSVPVVTTQQKYASKIVNGEEKEWHEVQDEKELENDRRAFTKQERDIIISAFYQSQLVARSHLYAPLIEFYFLTGCRTSEALPLTWRDVDFERNIIRFSKSLGITTQKVKNTKTGEARLFYFSENSRLKQLLREIKNQGSNHLIFPGNKGKFVSVASIAAVWSGYKISTVLTDGVEKTYCYPGVITKLIEEGLISGYLSPYHTRHTYITLTAHANAHNNNALLHIATACGNSIDVILRHYLGVSESVELTEV